MSPVCCQMHFTDWVALQNHRITESQRTREPENTASVQKLEIHTRRAQNLHEEASEAGMSVKMLRFNLAEAEAEAVKQVDA